MPVTEENNQQLLLIKAAEVLLDTWRQGRKALVVLGAGASVAAEIPLMRSVYSDLARRFPKNLDDAQKQRFLISEIKAQLDALAAGDAPRSLAAMALGTLQRAHERVREDAVFKKLEETWNSFSNDFIAGKIQNAPADLPTSQFTDADFVAARRAIAEHPFGATVKQSPPVARAAHPPATATALADRTPTQLHFCVARWAERGWAHLVSVNFDGLTRKALSETLSARGGKSAAVVLSQPESIAKFALGDDGDVDFSVPVVKVWGDVFHAVCTNARCPESGLRVPIFRLQKTEPGETPDHDCPSCHKRRQLQIFFTGYEEKEKTTQELMGELLRFLAPQIGCVVTIGFSGLWDQALVQFVAAACGQIDRENKSTNPGSAACICVDPEEHPSLLHDMALHDVRPLHLRMTAEEFASVFDLEKTSVVDQPSVVLKRHEADPYAFHEGMWDSWLPSFQPSVLPGTYLVLQQHPHYLPGFNRLRQLGIKTLVALATAGHGGKDGDRAPKENEHNRLWHSRGAGHLATLWFRQLSRQLPDGWKLSPERTEHLCAITLYAAMHHDIGHLPFTHLAEEIFEEVHWSLEDWDQPFKHDEPVLAHPFEDFESDVNATVKETAAMLDLPENRFRHWAECAIHGRSGYPWIDAILNSPLDVDKLDYVFRDCHYLRQGLHISVEKREAWKWMGRLFEGARVLPSGLVALEGAAGEQARDFLEERWWLYRHRYFQPGFRALERLARAVIIQWLLVRVPEEIATGDWHSKVIGKVTTTVTDPSSLKGRIARTLLWRELKKRPVQEGEPQLLIWMAEELQKRPSHGLPPSPRVVEWAKRCAEIFARAFRCPPELEAQPTLLAFLKNEVRITCSDSFYVPFDRLETVREVIRHIETQRPFRALIDLAVFPRMLAYPARRRFRWQSASLVGECFAVADYDPDRWGASTNRWTPMSESAYAEKDRARWAKIMVVSPFEDDPEVWHAVDRFRNVCRGKGIRVVDVDPDEAHHD
jgi:NAD-dependent SIR2 family protein deacetylase